MVVLAFREVWRAVMAWLGTWSSSVLSFWCLKIAAGSAIKV